MSRSTSRVLSLVSNSGFNTVACPSRASTAVPPLAGLGTVATGWHPARARAAANAAAASALLEMRRHPDVGDRADKESADEDPGGPVNLPLQATPGSVAAAQARVAAADRAAEAGSLRRLDEHARHQEHRQHRL